jgi:undecaprenyl-diphosphatase
MLDLFHNIAMWFELFLESISSNFWLSFWFVFAIALGEAVFILGLFVPSTPVLLLAGGLMAQGKLPFWEIYLGAVVGAVVGDAISYTVGYWLRDRIKTIWPFKHYLKLIERGEVFFAKHGGKSVFFGRFIPGVKAVVPGIAGIYQMDYRKFSIINVTSAFAWAAAHILPGLLLSAWLQSIGLSLELVIVVGTLVLLALFLIVHYWKQILLAAAPYLGSFGRSLQERWRKPNTEAGH